MKKLSKIKLLTNLILKIINKSYKIYIKWALKVILILDLKLLNYIIKLKVINDSSIDEIIQIQIYKYFNLLILFYSKLCNILIYILYLPYTQNKYFKIYEKLEM